MRTNIVIDNKLMEQALAVSGLKTKREAVEEALKTLIRVAKQREGLKYFGTVQWEGDLDEMRRD